MRPDSYYDKLGIDPPTTEELGNRIERAIFSFLKKLGDRILWGIGFGIGFLLIHIIATYVNIL
jgi:hypothetical protein